MPEAATKINIIARIIKIALKTVGYLVGGVLGLVVVILVAINFLLQTGFFTDFVLGQALPPVEQAICAKIKVDSLRLSLIPFSLQIEGVVFTDPEEKFDYPFATLKRLTVKVKTGPLLSGKVVAKTVSIEGVTNYLYLRDGLENMPMCPSQPEAEPEPEEPPSDEPFKLKLPIVVENLHIDAAFRMAMPSTTPEPTEENPEPQPSTPVDVAIASINLDGQADLNSGDAKLALRVGGVDFAMGEMREKLEEIAIDAEANLQEWNARVPKLAIKTEGLSVTAIAQATDLLGEMELEADLGVDAELNKVNQLVLTKPEDMQLAGLLTLASRFKMKLGKEKLIYVADGTISLPEGRVNELALRDLGAEFTVTPEHAKVPRFHLGVGGGALDLAAQVGLADSMPLNATVKIDRLDVGDSLRRFGLKGIAAAGVLSMDLSANGGLQPMNLQTVGDISLAQAGYGEIKAQKIDVNLDARVGIESNDVKQLRVVVADLLVGEASIPQATLLLEGTVGTALNKIQMLRLTTAHTEVDIDGTANLNGPLDMNVEVKLGDLEEFAGFVGGKRLAGSGGLKATIGGTIKNPEVEGNLQFMEVFFDKMEVDALHARLGFANKKATVSNLLLESAGAVIKLEAAYDMSEETPLVQANLQLAPTEIQNLLVIAGMADDLKVDGLIGLNAKVEGPVDGLNGSVKLQGAKIEAFKEKVESLGLNARLENGTVLLDDLTIVKMRGIRPVFQRGMWRPKPENQITEDDREPTVVKLTGKVDPNEKTFAVKLETLRLSETSSDTVVRERIHAIADIDLAADFAGTFDNPDGALRLAIKHGRFEHLDLGDSFIDVKIADKQLRVTGSLLENRRPVSLEDRQEKKKADPTPTPETKPEAEPDEDFGEPEAKFDDDPDFSILPALALIEPGDDEEEDDEDEEEPATPDSPAAEDLGKITINVTLGLDGEKPLDAKIVFDNFDYSNFLKSKEQVKQFQRGEKQEEDDDEEQVRQTEVFGGVIRGAITVGGKLAKPELPEGVEAEEKPLDINAEVRFDEIMFQQNDFVIKNQDEQRRLVPILIRYRQGSVDVESFALGGKGVKIDLERTDLRGEPFFVLTAVVQLGIAKAFTTALSEANGKLDLRAEIPVKFDLDKVTADIDIPLANFAMPNVPTGIDKFKLKVRFEERTATVKQLSAEIGGGTLEGGGTIRLPGRKKDEPSDATGDRPAQETDREADKKEEKTQIDLFIKLHNVKTGIDPYVEITLDKVEILISTRRDGKMDISGEVDIAKALVSYEVDVITLFKMFQKPRGSVAGSEVYEKKEETTFFNIAIRAPRNVTFENTQAQIELKIDLVLTGSNVSPGMIGTVEVVKGRAQVLQNEYRITSAVIQFFDETRIFPAFDINAGTEVNEIKIYINVSGTPERYNISFMSDPPMPEREIFTLLSLGVSYAEFQAGAGPEAAAVALAQQLVVGKTLRNYTGFDFGIDTSTGTSRLKISGELEKDLRLSIFRGISDPTLAAELEYGFIRYFAVYSEWSNFAGQENVPPSGGYGAGVRLKIDFR